MPWVPRILKFAAVNCKEASLPTLTDGAELDPGKYFSGCVILYKRFDAGIIEKVFVSLPTIFSPPKSLKKKTAPLISSCSVLYH